MTARKPLFEPVVPRARTITQSRLARSLGYFASVSPMYGRKESTRRVRTTCLSTGSPAWARTSSIVSWCLWCLTSWFAMVPIGHPST